MEVLDLLTRLSLDLDDCNRSESVFHCNYKGGDSIV